MELRVSIKPPDSGRFLEKITKTQNAVRGMQSEIFSYCAKLSHRKNDKGKPVEKQGRKVMGLRL
jgi:predicted RNA-binding protein YlqC (UPF0109 family)